MNLVTDNQIINSLGSVVLPWTSSLELVKGVDIKATPLLVSSPKAWTQTGQFSLDPNKIPPPMPMPGMGEKERPLAVLLQGTFKSFYAGKPAPAVSEGSTSEKEPPPRLDKSAETAILVVGSSKFVRDDFLGLGDSNLDFVLNAIDWMTLGGKLIGVRSRISTDRPFAPEINQCITEGYCTKGSFPRLLFARILGPFLLPIAVVIYGLVRFQFHRRSKKSWAAAQAQKGGSK
jgi:ABC-2 type transport system permease protein